LRVRTAGLMGADCRRRADYWLVRRACPACACIQSPSSRWAAGRGQLAQRRVVALAADHEAAAVQEQDGVQPRSRLAV